MPTKFTGLTSGQAKKRLARDGPNSLPEKPPPSSAELALRQIKNPFVYLLLAAGVVTLFLNHTSDAVIIFVAVIVNSILGFIQEKRAGNALSALKRFVHLSAQLIRGGEFVQVSTEEIVVGDVVVLSQGDRVPADGVLLEVNRLSFLEGVLTGESRPVAKKAKDKVFMGATVAVGKGLMQVSAVGVNTEFGKIGQSIQEDEEDTPLKKQLTKFSKQLSWLVLALAAIVFFLGVLFGRNLSDMFATSVALSVSAIPEGLLIAFTVVLAIGMQKIVKRKGLVRNLVSAETLGGVTVVCVDKTGTLTQGKMGVVEFIGSVKELARQVILSNDLDDPMTVAALKWAKRRINNYDIKIKDNARIDALPFSSKERFFASLNKTTSKRENAIYVQGAPDYVLEWSIVRDDKKKKILREIEKLTGEGKRLIGLARKVVPSSVKTLKPTSVKAGLEWVGILAFSDPVRKGVKNAIAKTRAAGVKIIVITGDYPQTAVHVMTELDIRVEDSCVVLGPELERMSELELRKSLESKNCTDLFARTTPSQKLKIVDALKKNGEVVAMMGDGVNDAPALKRADIGIVVGSATDVARESADLVLVDSGFSTIVAAIEEGRGIFGNLRKIILYLMSDAFGGIVAVLGALVIGFPLPVTAAQILWVNLVSDGFPDLALTVDGQSREVMKMSPKYFGQEIISGWMKLLIGVVSMVGGLVSLLFFVYYYSSSGDIVLARSIAFISLGVNSLFYVFSTRTLTEPLWESNPFSNNWLNIAVVAGFILQFVPFVSDGLRTFFGLSSIGLEQVGAVLISGVLVVVLIEVIKLFLSNRVKWFRF